ncbi:hypothetical protein ACET3Z_001202 [Daucus carota]
MELLRFGNQGFLEDEDIVNDESTFTHTVNDGEVAVNNLNGDAAQSQEVSTNHPTNGDSGNMDDRNEGTSHSNDSSSTDQVRDLPRATKWNRDYTNDLIVEPKKEKSEFEKEVDLLFEKVNMRLEEETEKFQKEEMGKGKVDILAHKEKLETPIEEDKEEALKKFHVLFREFCGDKGVYEKD